MNSFKMQNKTTPRKDLRILYVLFGVLILLDISALICYWITAYVTTRPIELGIKGECNSGNIGVDYQSVYNSSYSLKENITFFGSKYESKQTIGWTPRIFTLKGIDGLNCKFELNSKIRVSDLIVLAKALE